jgi:hypothetical protein
MPIIHKRLYRVPPGSELSKVRQVWIIESLQDDERHTGIVIRDHLFDLFLARDIKVQVTLRQVASAAELCATLEALREDVQRTRDIRVACPRFEPTQGGRATSVANVVVGVCLYEKITSVAPQVKTCQAIVLVQTRVVK